MYATIPFPYYSPLEQFEDDLFRLDFTVKNSPLPNCKHNTNIILFHQECKCCIVNNIKRKPDSNFSDLFPKKYLSVAPNDLYWMKYIGCHACVKEHINMIQSSGHFSNIKVFKHINNVIIDANTEFKIDQYKSNKNSYISKILYTD